MTRQKSYLLLLVVLAICGPASAATNYVIQGATNFQATIDASSPGDYLVVQGAPYFENLTFSKPVTVLRSGTNLIQLQGTVQIQGTGAVNFAQSQFGNTVNMQCTGTVSFSQCTFLSTLSAQSGNLLIAQGNCQGAVAATLSAGGGTNLQAFDTTFSGTTPSLSLTGGKAVIKRCTLNGLTLSGNSALEALRITNNAFTTASAPNGSSPSFVAVQSYFAGLSLNNYKVWLGYNYPSGTYLYSILMTNCDAVLVGNRILANYAAGYPAGLYCQGCNIKAYNNVLYSGTFYTVWLRSSVAELVNNTIVVAGSDSRYRVMYVSDGGGPVTVRGCILYRMNNWGYGIESTGPTVNVSYCAFYNSASSYAAEIFGPGVSACPTCVGGVNAVTIDYNNFPPGPPCIAAGPPEPIYNNRNTIDRNDIGWTGGPLYNPANFTNSNPMVFLLTGSPQNVFKGQTTNILINAAASAGH
jgi:hypothetical protein